MHLPVPYILTFFFDSNFNCLPADLREAYKKGSIFPTLRQLSPTERHFQYAQQSVLLRQRDDGIEISPLLHLLQDGALPSQQEITQPEVAPAVVPTLAEPQPAVTPAPVAVTSARPKWAGTWQQLVAFLKTETASRCVLPPVVLTGGEIRDWQAFQAPLPQAKPEPDDTQQAIVLRHAAPEFTAGDPASEQTAVYLAGLFLHFQLLGRLPLAETLAVAALQQRLANDEVALDMQQWPAVYDRRLAMVLKRSLKREPTARYQTLDSLASDVKALLF